MDIEPIHKIKLLYISNNPKIEFKEGISKITHLFIK